MDDSLASRRWFIGAFVASWVLAALAILLPRVVAFQYLSILAIIVGMLVVAIDARGGVRWGFVSSGLVAIPLLYISFRVAPAQDAGSGILLAFAAPPLMICAAVYAMTGVILGMNWGGPDEQSADRVFISAPRHPPEPSTTRFELLRKR